MTVTDRKLCIISFPSERSGNIPLSNFIELLRTISNNIILVTGNDGYKYFDNYQDIKIFGVRHIQGLSLLSRILRYLLTQIRISAVLVSNIGEIEVAFLYFGGDMLLLPILVMKIFRRRTVLVLPSSSKKVAKAKNDNLQKFIDITVTIIYKFSDYIIITAKNSFIDYDLQVFEKKVRIANDFFIDIAEFTINIPITQRRDVIGFIGRFSDEKGIINFVDSISEIKKLIPRAEFLIIGDGQHHQSISRFIADNRMQSDIELIQWVDHEELPRYLNIIKVLVVPSFTETGPIIAFEAMSCGTLVLATSVGKIPEVICDGENGFTLSDNSPVTIAEGVINVLSNSKLEVVSSNARKTIINTMTLNSVKKRVAAVYREVSQ